MDGKRGLIVRFLLLFEVPNYYLARGQGGLRGGTREKECAKRQTVHHYEARH